MPTATCETSASTISHRFAIELMNEIFVARNAFDAYLIISADAGSVDEHRRLDRRVERRSPAPRLGVVAADHDAVRVEEVVDRVTFAEELGVGRDGDAVARRARSERIRCTNRVEPTGTVDLLMTTAPGRSTGAISRATASTYDMSAAPSSPSGVGTHRNTKSASRGRVRRADDELEPPARDAGGDELGQPVLEDRHLALAQPRDAIGVDVGARHVVAEVGQAGRGRQAT